MSLNANVMSRYYTQKKAMELNVTGWVRNTPNDKVRIA